MAIQTQLVPQSLGITERIPASPGQPVSILPVGQMPLGKVVAPSGQPIAALPVGQPSLGQPSISQSGVAMQAQPLQAQAAMSPPTGLVGSEMALGGTLGQLRSILSPGGASLGGVNIGAAGQQADLSGVSRGVAGQIGQGVSALSPFAASGRGAIGIQEALSGLQGREAFNEALIDSPVQQFLREQGQRAVTSQAAALGGLGGGNVQRELARFGQGLAGQQLQQQLSNIQNITGRGLQAAGQQAQLRGQQAGITSALGQTQASLNQQRALQAQSLSAQAARQQADIAAQQRSQLASGVLGLGGQLAQGRTRAAEQIAGQVGGTTSALSGLISQQGLGLSDLIGRGGTTLAGLLGGLSESEAAALQNEATLLANLATSQGSQSIAAQVNPVFAPQDNSTANMLGAIGGIASAFQNRPQP